MISLKELAIKLSGSIFHFDKRCQNLEKSAKQLCSALHTYCENLREMTQNTDKNQIRHFIKQIEELASDSNLLFAAIYQVNTKKPNHVLFKDGWVNISIREQTLLEEMITNSTISSPQVILLSEMTN
jgi:hypothetical protein